MSHRDISVSAYVKYALSMMSDRTFLSSIDYLNFRYKVIKIRPGYWKCFVCFVKSNYKLNRVGYVLSTLKNLFIERFVLCDAKNIKDYFIGRLRRSFFNFSGILNYITTSTGLPFKKKKNFEKLRKLNYYERKAANHFKYLKNIKSLRPQVQENQHQQEVPEIFESLEAGNFVDSDQNELFNDDTDDQFTDSLHSEASDLYDPTAENIDSSDSLSLQSETPNNRNDSDSNSTDQSRSSSPLLPFNVPHPYPLNTIWNDRDEEIIVTESERSIEYVGSTAMSEQTITTTTVRQRQGVTSTSSTSEVVTQMLHRGRWV